MGLRVISDSANHISGYLSLSSAAAPFAGPPSNCNLFGVFESLCVHCSLYLKTASAQSLVCFVLFVVCKLGAFAYVLLQRSVAVSARLAFDWPS